MHSQLKIDHSNPHSCGHTNLLSNSKITFCTFSKNCRPIEVHISSTISNSFLHTRLCCVCIDRYRTYDTLCVNSRSIILELIDPIFVKLVLFILLFSFLPCSFHHSSSSSSSITSGVLKHMIDVFVPIFARNG